MYVVDVSSAALQALGIKRLTEGRNQQEPQLVWPPPPLPQRLFDPPTQGAGEGDEEDVPAPPPLEQLMGAPAAGAAAAAPAAEQPPSPLDGVPGGAAAAVATANGAVDASPLPLESVLQAPESGAPPPGGAAGGRSTEPVVVVGSGPAGLFAALTLAEAGIKVGAAWVGGCVGGWPSCGVMCALMRWVGARA